MLKRPILSVKCGATEEFVENWINSPGKIVLLSPTTSSRMFFVSKCTEDEEAQHRVE